MNHMETCPICGKEFKYNDFFEPYVDRMRNMTQAACGFEIDRDVFKTLCESCMEWVLYLSTEKLLEKDLVNLLRGDSNGIEENQAPLQGR